MAILTALMFPTSGVTRGLRAIFQHSIWSKTPLQKACRSGALCVVVRTEDWKPRDGEIVKGVWLQEGSSGEQQTSKATVTLSQKNNEKEATSHSETEARAFFRLLTQDPLALKTQTAESHTATLQTVPQVEDNTDGPVGISGTSGHPDESSRSITEEKSSRVLPKCGVWNIGKGRSTPFLPATHGFHKRSRVVHGTCHLPPGYALSVLRSGTKITKSAIDTIPSRQIRDQTGFHDRQQRRWFAKSTPDEELIAGHHPQVYYSDALSMSYSLCKALVAIFQLLYASWTLYKTKGDQLEHYGYAAFGLTVTPYLVMSLTNLLGNILTPDFPALYLVRNDVMDEAARREGGLFVGIIGSVEDVYKDNGVDVTFQSDTVRGTIFITATGRHASSAVQSNDGICIVNSADLEVEQATLRKLQPPSFIAIPSNSVTGNSGEQKEEFVTAVLLGTCVVTAIVFAIIGYLSRFRPGNSSFMQRWATMLWLICGTLMGAGVSIEALGNRTPETVWRAWGLPNQEKLVSMTAISLIINTPAYMGFAAVAGMLITYGHCVRLG